jgi:hypothetical protein
MLPELSINKANDQAPRIAGKYCAASAVDADRFSDPAGQGVRRQRFEGGSSDHGAMTRAAVVRKIEMAREPILFEDGERSLTRSDHCQAYFRARKLNEEAAAARGVGKWSVPNLCRAYDWPNGLPGGGTIALIELNGGWNAADIKAYFDSIVQPIPQIVDCSVDGTQNNPGQHLGDPSDPDIEVTLDIEIAGASYFVATGKPASIRVYWASGGHPQMVATAIQKAAADGCDVCCISWGSGEANWKAWSEVAGRDLIQELENSAIAATNAGMIVLAGAGDNNASDGGPGQANVDIPAACPHVLACGGTSKDANAEQVWNNDPGNPSGSGTGGGFSTVFPPQPFQAGAPSGPGRMIPDISAHADIQAGYTIFVHGGFWASGGTSAVGPLYAGLFAAIGTKLGFVTPTLWANHVCFNDITVGDNGFYRAGPGPDACSGLGSPIGSRLTRLLSRTGPQPRTLVQPKTPSGPGWSGTIRHTYRNGVLVDSASTELRTTATGAEPKRKGRRTKNA